MLRVDYRVLGALQADAGAARLSGQRVRDVLGLLLARRGRPLAPEVILDAVWAEDALALDASVVHTVIARLRRALGVAAITRHDTGYQLAADATVDADEFTRLVTAARALVPERRGEIVGLLQRALALWRGPEAYAGVSDALVVTDRPRLHELRDTAIEHLAERLLEQGSPVEIAEAVVLAADLASREPLRERAHELLMTGLYRQGRQGEALSVFDRLRRGLRDELGLDPRPQTQALHARMLAHDLTAPVPVPAQSPVSAGSPRGRAPLPRTRTIGREDELAALTRTVAERRLSTIVGPGGVGKSRLLLEYAARLPDQAEVLYVELPGSSDSTAAEVAEAIARTAGWTLGGGDTLSALTRALGHGAHLLLLDEAEWAAAAVTELAERIVTDCPQTRLVLTSRIPLSLQGEGLLVVAPLTVPAPGSSPADVADAPAVRLLAERLSDHAPGLVPTAQDYLRMAEITRRVDGLPLAVEIVAGQAAASSVATLLALVERPLDIEASETDRTPRQRSLRETLSWSIERLSPTARSAWARLGTFSGAFDLAAAEAVIGALPTPETRAVSTPTVGALPTPTTAAAGDGPADAAAIVRSLTREGHLQVERGSGQVRMKMLRSARDLAREHLGAEGELEAVRARHRRWFAARWRDQPLSDALIADVAQAYPDYLAALRDSLATQDAETLGDLAVTLSRYWFFAETGSEGIRLVRASLDSGCLSARHTAVLRLLEAALLPQDQGVDVRAGLDLLVPQLAQDADWLGRLHILRSVGPYVHGDFVLAWECAEAAVEVARERAPHHLPEALGARAVMLAALGRHELAVADAGEAWRLIAADPSAVDLTQVVPKVALALIDSDHPGEALDILDRALAQVEDRLGLAPTSLFTINAGWAALGCREPHTALRRFAQTLDHLAGGGDLLVTGEVLAGAGAAMSALGAAGAREVQSAATQHLRDAGVVLTPWQQGVLARHRAPGGHASTVLPAVDLSRAITLIRAALPDLPT